MVAINQGHTTTRISARVDSAVKQKAAQVLAAYGMDLSTGISLFVSQVANTERFPFNLERSPYESLLKESMQEESIPMSSVDDFLNLVNDD